jgi:adenylate kinase
MKEKEKMTAIQAWLGQGSINIFGLPFSGKDTHGTKLADSFQATFISGGDILRSSNEHQQIQRHIAKGNLAPTDAYLAIVLPYLSKGDFAGKPLILSSVGRWHGEEPSVLKAAKESGHPIKAAIYLSIKESEAEKRWEGASRGRADDAARHIVLNRFKEFREKTLAVVEYYRQAGLLIEIDAMPAKDLVTADILTKLLAMTRAK